MTFCGSCGAQSGGAEQRFCAACGQPLAAPPPIVPAPRSGGRSSRATLLVAAGVVVALVAGSVTAWALLRPNGGSDNPEAAVRAFLAAAESQDVVAMLDQLNPGEVKGFTTAYEAARERAVDEDLVGNGKVADAFTVELSGLELETHQEADDIAQVTLERGRYTVTYDPAKVPGRLTKIADAHPDALEWEGDLLGDDGSWMNYWPGWWLPVDPYAEDADDEQVEDTLRPSVDVVRVDGRWYVSLVRIAAAYTGLYYQASGNYGYESGELDWAAADEEREPIIGETPEEVVDNVVAAVNSLDPDDLLDSFPGDEVIALRPLVPTVERALRDEVGRVDVSVDDLDLSTEDRGDTVVVTLEGGRASGASDDGYGEVEYSQGCFFGSLGEQCIADEAGFEPVRDPFVVMEKVDGGYQLSWSATAAEYALLYAESMPDRLVDELVEELSYEAGVHTDGY